MKTTLVNTAILIATIIFIFLLTSCSYYRVLPQSQPTSQSFEEYDDAGRYLILHRDDEAWHISDIQLSNDSMLVKLEYNLGYHSNYLNPKMNGLNQFKKNTEPDVIREVHLYTSDNSFGNLDTIISLPVSAIDSAKYTEYARAPSRASIVVPVVFVPVIGFTALMLYGHSQAKGTFY